MASGNFFPVDYKEFPFQEGDLLVSRRKSGKFAVNKILKVDRFNFEQGTSIIIQGQPFVATENDYLLVVSTAYGEDEFSSMEEARTAAQTGTWTVKIGHIPNRPPGATAGQTLVGNKPIADGELSGYKVWREAFGKGEAGIF